MNQVVQLACARGPEGTLRVALGGEWKLARGVPAPRLVIQEIGATWRAAVSISRFDGIPGESPHGR